MGIVSIAFSLIVAFLAPLHCGAEATGSTPPEMGVCGNQRYEDFNQRLREAEERDLKREKYALEIKEVRRQHDVDVEKARVEYIKARVRTVEDPRQEKLAGEADKAWREQNEMERRRYVERKAESEKTRCHSLRIPELKEYDLENY